MNGSRSSMLKAKPNPYKQNDTVETFQDKKNSKKDSIKTLKCLATYQEKKLPNRKVNKTNKVWVPASSKYDAPKISRTHLNQTKPSPLLLGSCSYIDLTIAQSMCGPGYKAMVEKLDLSLHHSIFFDNIS